MNERGTPLWLLADSFYLTGTAFFLAVTVIYFFTATWWENRISRMLMSISAGVTAIGFSTCLVIFFGPEYTGRGFARFIVGAIFCLLALLFFMTFITERTKPLDQIEEEFTSRGRPLNQVFADLFRRERSKPSNTESEKYRSSVGR